MKTYEDCAIYKDHGDVMCAGNEGQICLDCPCGIMYIDKLKRDRIEHDKLLVCYDIGKHEKIDVNLIREACRGDCFHGEVWVRCPWCGTGNEMVGAKPFRVKDGYRIYKCQCCGGFFKHR